MENLIKLRNEVVSDLLKAHEKTIRNALGKLEGKLTPNDIYKFFTEVLESRELSTYEDIMYTVGQIDMLSKLIKSN